MVRKPSDELSGIPALTFPPALLRLPLSLPLHPQPQPRLHPSGSYSEGEAVAVQNCKIFILGGAVAHFDHRMFVFFWVSGGSMDVQ